MECLAFTIALASKTMINYCLRRENTAGSPSSTCCSHGYGGEMQWHCHVETITWGRTKPDTRMGNSLLPSQDRRTERDTAGAPSKES